MQMSDCVVSILIVMSTPLVPDNTLTHWGRDKMAVTLADDTFKRKVVNENILISMKIWLNFVSKGPLNNVPALV